MKAIIAPYVQRIPVYLIENGMNISMISKIYVPNAETIVKMAVFDQKTAIFVQSLPVPSVPHLMDHATHA